jgi:hypothetical protein
VTLFERPERAATSSANCQFAREMRFGARGERAGLCVPHLDQLQASTGADDIRDSVQRVAGHSINALNTRFHEYIHNQVRHFFFAIVWLLASDRKKS